MRQDGLTVSSGDSVTTASDGGYWLHCQPMYAHTAYSCQEAAPPSDYLRAQLHQSRIEVIVVLAIMTVQAIVTYRLNSKRAAADAASREEIGRRLQARTIELGHTQRRVYNQRIRIQGLLRKIARLEKPLVVLSLLFASQLLGQELRLTKPDGTPIGPVAPLPGEVQVIHMSADERKAYQELLTERLILKQSLDKLSTAWQKNYNAMHDFTESVAVAHGIHRSDLNLDEATAIRKVPAGPFSERSTAVGCADGHPQAPLRTEMRFPLVLVIPQAACSDSQYYQFHTSTDSEEADRNLFVGVR